jgi:DNA (cytosine-5)-methyltransferase 1
MIRILYYYYLNNSILRYIAYTFLFLAIFSIVYQRAGDSFMLQTSKSSTNNEQVTFIDLFAGIGGFHVALHQLGGNCVYASEWDEHARKTYEANFSKLSPELFKAGLFRGDITLDENQACIPENTDILCAGFPCQPFSQAGVKKGFNETRGTLFFEIAKIIKDKRPKAIFLENVRGLLNHDNGKTFEVIRNILENELNYTIYYKVIKASDYGLPTHRPRIYIVGFRSDVKYKKDFKFPNPIPLKFTMSDIFNMPCNKDVGYTLRVGGKGSGINDRRNWDSYLVGGEVKKITPVEGKKMMGFPDDFIFPVTHAQAMKQLGNSVAIDPIRLTSERIIKILRKSA